MKGRRWTTYRKMMIEIATFNMAYVKKKSPGFQLKSKSVFSISSRVHMQITHKNTQKQFIVTLLCIEKSL